MTHWSINMQDGAHFGFEKPERTLEEIIEHERVRAPLFGYTLLCCPSTRVCDAVLRFLFRRVLTCSLQLHRCQRGSRASRASQLCSIRKSFRVCFRVFASFVVRVPLVQTGSALNLLTAGDADFRGMLLIRAWSTGVSPPKNHSPHTFS